MATNYYNKLFKKVNSGEADSYWEAAQQEKKERKKQINEEESEE